MNQPPTWAARSVPDGEGIAAVPPEDHEPKKAALLPLLGAGALVVLVGAAGFALARSGDSSDDVATDGTTTSVAESTTTSTAPSTTPETAVAPTTVPPTTAPPTTAPSTTAVPTTTPAPTTLPDAAATAEAEAAVAEAANVERRAVLKGGKLYLRGLVPSEEVATAIVERAAAVVGPDNVVDEYVVDPTAPFPESAPLFVEDLVLFAYGSDQINPDFVPLLELGTALLSQNPQVIITVVSHTDARGTEEYNQQLSERRGVAVKQYWTDRGIDPDQIIIDARGESMPRADNSTLEGAQLNRRAEFIIANLLG